MEHSHSQDTPTKERPPAHASAADFPIIQAGRYKLITLIGSGGAGTVYKAQDTTLDKTVAIKKLHNSANQAQAIRFQREARLVAALRHENVMSARDFGVTENNEPYLILDYVDGESLRKLLKRAGPLPESEALEIFIQTARGISHAHKNKILHRDIKPSNVMLVSEKFDGKTVRVAKIVDFGLAKDLGNNQNLTLTGAACGTPTYMSPEQARGREVDYRSDIYSFGCLMYETLTGHPPFLGETAIETANLHASADAPLMSSSGNECSGGMEHLVARCLNKVPDSRYQSFEDLLTSLQELQDLAKQRETILTEHDAANAKESDNEQDSKTKNGKIQRNILIGLVVSSAVLFGGTVAYKTFFAQPEESGQETESGHQKQYSKVLGLMPSELWEVNGEFLRSTQHGALSGSVQQKNCYMCYNATDEGLETWLKQKSPTVDQLYISETHLTKKGFDLLAKNNLKAIAFVDSPVTKELMHNICRIKSLKTVALGETKAVDPAAFAELESLPKLDRLELTFMPLDARIFKYISELENLGGLNFRSCTGITAEGIEYLSKLKHLETVKFNGTDINDVSGANLAHCTIKDLRLSETAVSDKLLARLHDRYLWSVDLQHTKVTKRGVELLMQKNPNRELKVYFENVTPTYN